MSPASRTALVTVRRLHAPFRLSLAAAVLLAAASAADERHAHGAAPRTHEGDKKPRTKAARPSSGAKSGRSASSGGAGSSSAATDGLPFAIGRPSKVTPNQQGKIVVFPFRNDDGGGLATQVGQLLAARGLDIMSEVKPVDSAEQFRDMATALGLAAYVDGDVRGTEANMRATIRLRSGYTGRKVAEMTIKESRENLPRAISDGLWTKLGPPMARVCADATKPRKKSRSTLEIDAGTPLENHPETTRPRARPAAPPTPSKA